MLRRMRVQSADLSSSLSLADRVLSCLNLESTHTHRNNIPHLHTYRLTQS